MLWLDVFVIQNLTSLIHGVSNVSCDDNARELANPSQ